MSLLFPRNIDEDRLRGVAAKLEGVYSRLSDTDRATLQRFLKHFNHKFFISEPVMERFVEEVCAAAHALNDDDARQACAYSLGYVSWRQMYARRCTREMLDTKMGKIRRYKNLQQVSTGEQ